MQGYYYPRTLLVDDTPLIIDEKEYFGERLTCDLSNCTAYTGILEKNFLKFTLIEIINELEVKTHYSFIHPVYTTENFQRIHISDDLDYMIERLQNQRVFFYKRIPFDDSMSRWQIIRRINQFPMDISDFTSYLYLFSPNLQYYLDFDKADDCF